MNRPPKPKSMPPQSTPPQSTPDDDYAQVPPPRRWKRRIIIALAVLLILLIGAEWLVSSIMASKLRSTLGDKLDAKLQLGPLLYLPPYGVIVFNPQVTRDGQTLFAASRIKLSLAGLPSQGKPLIIASLRLVSPQLYLSPAVFNHPSAAASEPSGPSRKLSEILRLSDVHISDGKIQWRDPARGNLPPMSWESLSLDVDTAQESASRYSFHLVSRAQLTADASATGELDVDSLEMQLKSLVLKVRAEPDPTRSPLPQAVQQWLKAYQVNGELSVSGSAAMSLHDLPHAAFSAAISLDDAVAQIPDVQFAIDRAKAALTADKKSDGPIVVQLQSIDVASGGKSVTVNKGQITLDAAAGRWAVAGLEGRLSMDKPAKDAVATTESSSPLEKLQPAGRADFTAVASAPFQFSGKPWEAIDHEIVIYPRGVSFVPIDFAHRIEDVGGGEIRVKGGMIICQELSARYGTDAIRIRSARVPLDGLPKLAKVQEISASIAFHQPIARYAPVLDNLLDVVHPDGLVLIAGSYTVDKRSPDSNTTYDLILSTDNCSFTLTPKKIPLQHVRGDVTLTPAGAQLHGGEAELFGGHVTATGQWTRTSDSRGNFDGDLTMRDVDLSRADELSERTSEASLKGKLYAEATFSGATDSDRPAADWGDTLRASGEFEVIKGDFFRLPVLKEITSRIRGLKQASTAGDAAAVFDVADSTITLRNAAINAPILGLQGGGKVGFNGQVDINVVAAPLADWRDKFRETKIPIVSNLAGSIAGSVQKLINTATGVFLYQFRVSGNLHDKVQVDAIPTPVLTDTSAAVFGRMLSATKDTHPLDWFRREQPTTQP